VKSQNPVGKPIDFDFNSAIIAPDSDERLQEIAEIVRHHFRLIVIQGHCSPDEAEYDPEGGHKLTCARANAVRNGLRKYGVAEKRLTIVSLAANAAPPSVNPEDRQLVIVTIGEYLLPTKNDLIDTGSTANMTDDKPPSSHGGH
jgi:outer membrane protein OmpA-like peptidoglycan-associated protein